MTERIVVRAANLASEKDASALLDLLNHYAQDPMGGGQALSDATLENLIARLKLLTNFHAALAWTGEEDQAQAVGLINCLIGFSTFAATPLLNVHDLVVRADHRGKGIGSALLGHAERLARDLGCCKMTLEVLSENTIAQRSYVRVGFRPYVLDPAAGHALLMVKPL
jgi:GNAT superfamily N-acetyltransferase